MSSEKTKVVQYPELLDNFGSELESVKSKLKGDTLKPAMMADIIKVINVCQYIQQLMVMMYNLNVTNFEKLADMVGNISVSQSEKEVIPSGNEK